MLNRYIAAALLICATCMAQETPPPPEQPKFYKLDFIVKELSGGKVTNSRSYMTIGRAEHSTQSIRTGDKVPIQSGNSGPQFTYIDVGVSIDVTDIAAFGPDLRMHVTADISNAEKDPSLPSFIIRQNRWSSSLVVPLRKPTLLFSSDSTSSKTQTQLELTATPLQ